MTHSTPRDTTLIATRRSMTELMGIATDLVAALGDWQYNPHVHVDVYADMVGSPQINLALAFEESGPQKWCFLEAAATATGAAAHYTASTGIGSVWVTDWDGTGVTVSVVATVATAVAS